MLKSKQIVYEIRLYICKLLLEAKDTCPDGQTDRRTDGEWLRVRRMDRLHVDIHVHEPCLWQVHKRHMSQPDRPKKLIDIHIHIHTSTYLYRYIYVCVKSWLPASLSFFSSFLKHANVCLCGGGTFATLWLTAGTRRHRSGLSIAPLLPICPFEV